MSDALREQLLSIMDRKDHWAWPKFAAGEVPLDRLKVHFQQEWATYVRDFPVLLARVLGHGPPDDVRIALAANIYEEQTGGLSHSEPHPELFLRMMEGCRYDRRDFQSVQLLPAAAEYRAFLDRASNDATWIIGAAVLTIFVEGSVHERREISAAGGHASPPDRDAIDKSVAQHPLVRVHGVPLSAMELARVHKRVEGGHRSDAWRCVVPHATTQDHGLLASAIEEALALWKSYRDGVARACGVG